MNQIDKNIAVNLRRIRKSKNMSLDMLAEQTGVSKSMLGQIERGESNPTVTTIGKIVEGLKVPFEELIYAEEATVLAKDWNLLPTHREKAGEYSSRLLLPYDSRRSFEVYMLEIQPGKCATDPSHGEKTWEYASVIQGKMQLEIGKEKYGIGQQGMIRFAGDQEHSYRNVGESKLVVQIILSHEI